MAGFFRVAFEGEFFNQKVVNILHYRSTDWLPGGGNPFDDVLGALDDVIAEVKGTFMSCMLNQYTLSKVTGIGYDDTYNIVTGSPLVRSLNESGGRQAIANNGAATTGIISLRCGEQVLINGVTGKSKRNRGYLAVGPLADVDVDSYSHLSTECQGLFDTFAQHLDNQIVGINLLATLIPIRIHEKWTKVLNVPVLSWRTYSDVLGYAVNRVASYRRSRQPEA